MELEMIMSKIAVLTILAHLGDCVANLIHRIEPDSIGGPTALLVLIAAGKICPARAACAHFNLN